MLSNLLFMALTLSLCDGFFVFTRGSQSNYDDLSPAIASSSNNYLDSLGSNNAKQTKVFEPTPFSVASPFKMEGDRGALVSAADRFQYVPILSQEQADKIANKVIACCKRNGFNPIAVYVIDASGSTIVSKRMDGCSPVGIPEFARAKAYSCVVNKYPSRVFRDRYTSDEASAKFCQMTSMVAVSGNQMAPFPGGILLKVSETIVGAVGVSGAAGDEDEYCAIRGVMEANLGLTTVPEVHVLHNVIDGEIDQDLRLPTASQQ
jgi:uncharacterized protein GlcG (DUF336 family)